MLKFTQIYTTEVSPGWVQCPSDLTWMVSECFPGFLSLPSSFLAPHLKPAISLEPQLLMGNGIKHQDLA